MKYKRERGKRKKKKPRNKENIQEDGIDVMILVNVENTQWRQQQNQQEIEEEEELIARRLEIWARPGVTQARHQRDSILFKYSP